MKRLAVDQEAQVVCKGSAGRQARDEGEENEQNPPGNPISFVTVPHRPVPRKCTGARPSNNRDTPDTAMGSDFRRAQKARPTFHGSSFVPAIPLSWGFRPLDR